MNSQLHERALAAKSAQPTAVQESAKGTVQRVDLLGREITILLSNGLKVFFVPPDCPIRLHGEPIKLRMVQPRDQAHVTFYQSPEMLVATRLELQPDSTFGCFRL